MNATVISELLTATIRIATPLLFAALGGLLSECAGTFAVGTEGMMLAGAFSGAVVAFTTHLAGAGLLASAVAGASLGGVVGLATTRFHTDHMVTGLAVNTLAYGLTSFLLRGLFGGQAPVIALPTLKPIPIPGLASLPGVGPVLFNQPGLTYVAFGLAAALHVGLSRTRLGLTLRAIGENPTAAFSLGLEPSAWRVAAVVAGGALAGLGGAVLSQQELGTFTDGMTHGRGFIALAAIVVGRWKPLTTALGCLLFGATSALALNIQGWGLPLSSYVLQMTPYLMALVVLSGLGHRVRMPAAIGTAFLRD